MAMIYKYFTIKFIYLFICIKVMRISGSNMRNCHENCVTELKKKKKKCWSYRKAFFALSKT